MILLELLLVLFSGKGGKLQNVDNIKAVFCFYMWLVSKTVKTGMCKNLMKRIRLANFYRIVINVRSTNKSCKQKRVFSKYLE